MKNVITSAIFVAITATSAFAGEKAQNLIDPVQVKISYLETQVDGLKTVATSLALQLRAALDNGSNSDEITYLQEQIIFTEEALVQMTADMEYQRELKRENADTINELEDDVEELEMIIDGYQNQNSNFEEQAAAWISEQEAIQSDLQLTIDVKEDLIVDLTEELDAVYEDLETAYHDMDDLDETILDLQSHNQDDQLTALTNIISGQDATIAAYDSALDTIASIVEADSEDALDEVLSFISSLDLDI